jgi:ABC-2 type transport system ATP-binding protein
MIEAKNLTKRFGEFTAVDNLSFQVKPGTVLGFLGPNGAGKSTTMKMITGFLTPTEGTAIVAGHDIQAAPLEAKRHMGYLPEGTPSYGDMTPVQFLHFIAEVRGFGGNEKQRRVDSVIEKADLKGVLHQPIDTLSKGYKRRVGLAQAIIHDPKILILDEPTDGLDPNQKFEVRNLIRNIGADKIVVISTHILEEVSAVCNRAMVIARGKVVADGTPEQLEAKSRYHQAVTLSLENANEAAGALSALPQVANVETFDNGKRITVFPKSGAIIFHAIADLVRERGWRVNDMRAEKGQLDEVFRTITGGTR